MPGFPILICLQLPELPKTYVHLGTDSIQLSYLLLSPSLLAINLSKHQGLFKGSSPLHLVAKILEVQLQHQCIFQCIFRTDFLEIDCFDILAVQRILRNFLQHHSLKASIPSH